MSALIAKLAVGYEVFAWCKACKRERKMLELFSGTKFVGHECVKCHAQRG